MLELRIEVECETCGVVREAKFPGVGRFTVYDDYEYIYAVSNGEEFMFNVNYLRADLENAFLTMSEEWFAAAYPGWCRARNSIGRTVVPGCAKCCYPTVSYELFVNVPERGVYHRDGSYRFRDFRGVRACARIIRTNHATTHLLKTGEAHDA